LVEKKKKKGAWQWEEKDEKDGWKKKKKEPFAYLLARRSSLKDLCEKKIFGLLETEIAHSLLVSETFHWKVSTGKSSLERTHSLQYYRLCVGSADFPAHKRVSGALFLTCGSFGVAQSTHLDTFSPVFFTLFHPHRVHSRLGGPKLSRQIVTLPPSFCGSKGLPLKGERGQFSFQGKVSRRRTPKAPQIIIFHASSSPVAPNLSLAHLSSAEIELHRPRPPAPFDPHTKRSLFHVEWATHKGRPKPLGWPQIECVSAGSGAEWAWDLERVYAQSVDRMAERMRRTEWSTQNGAHRMMEPLGVEKG